MDKRTPFTLPRSLLAAVAIAIAALAIPTAAHANVSCAYSAADKSVGVSVAADGDHAVVERSGTAIKVNGGSCGAATVTNTDTVKIVVAQGATWNVETDVSLAGGAFAPGATPEADTSEIEFEIYEPQHAVNRVGVIGAPVDSQIVYGTAGINLNRLESAGIDADVSVTGPVNNFVFQGWNGPDFVSAGGGYGTGSALSTVWLDAHGGGGQDTLIGGSDLDDLDGGSGQDVLSGQGGDDELYPGLGDDTVIGGPGRNRVGYEDAPGRISLNLGVTTPQDLGPSGIDTLSGIQEVWGTQYPDRLVGTGADEDFHGQGGNDQVFGGGGDDFVRGEEGDDLLSGGPGADGIFGGEGADTADYEDAPAGVHVDLSVADPQDTQGGGLDRVEVENVVGSGFGDVLTGDDGANALDALGGADVLTGGLGADTLRGDAGADDLRSRDGVADTVDCGSERDRFDADALDALTGCEPATGGSGGAGGTGGTTPGPTAGAPVLRVTVSRQRAARVARRGLAVRVRSSSDARVRLRVALPRRTARALGLASTRRIATRIVSVRGGARAMVRLRLRPRLAARIAALRRPRLVVRALARTQDGRVSRPVTRTVRLR